MNLIPIKLLLIILLPSLYLRYNLLTFPLTILTLSVILFIILSLELDFVMKLILVVITLIFYRHNILVFLQIKYFKIKNMFKKGESGIEKFSKSLYSSRFNLITNYKKLPSYPTIIICNYCTDLVENFATTILPFDMAFVISKDNKFINKFNKLIKYPIISKDNNYDDIKEQTINNIKEGRHVFNYVTKYNKGAKPKFISGIHYEPFKISQETGIPITIVAIDSIHYSKLGIIKKQNFRITIGDTFIVEDIQKSMYETKAYYQFILDDFMLKKYSKPSLYF